MARSDTVAQQDGRNSVWDFDDDKLGSERDGRAAATFWQRLRRAVIPMGSWRRAAAERNSAELSTQPSGSRGQALRDAHHLLHRQLRRNLALRAVMPDLREIEQALAALGSLALRELPTPVLRRGLMQLGNLPWDDAQELGGYALHILRPRLVEAIERRGLGAPLAGLRHGASDSALNSLSPDGLPPAGIVVDSLDDSHPDASAAAQGWQAVHPQGLDTHRR